MAELGRRDGPAELVPPAVAAPRRRTVAARLLAGYLVVLAAFAVTVGWSLLALRDAARDATLLRAAYVPLLISIGEALAGQNVLNAQLNHITAAKNPADVRQWIETAHRLRPLTFEKIRRDAERELPSAADASGLRDQVASETTAILRSMSDEDAKFDQLFQALQLGDRIRAEQLRDELLARETDRAKRLRALRDRVDDQLKTLIAAAQRREARSTELLVGLSVLTLAVGAAISFYARRVLRPLTAVTERARAVGRGDLAPREVVATDGEIGELATTFEGMVAAIRRARAELVHAERLATIGKMAAHISHEIRNPLSSIGLNLELLEEEIAGLDAKPEAAQLLGAIQGEVDRLSRITEQYLAAARQPRLHPEPARLDEIVRDCHAFVRPELERAGLESRVECDRDLPAVEVDQAQLRQALLNLLRNAQEATPRGGEIVLSVRRAPEGGVAIWVDDSGQGVPEELRSAIFDPFCTTKERGTGLGLAVTRSIVEAHGGTIHCEPRAGGGTRFCLALPAPERGARGAADHAGA
jgi:two-component system NtrC family sensor kinase